MPDFGSKGHQRFSVCGRRAQPLNHLDDLHQRHGVKEVKTQNLSRSATSLSYLSDRQRGGVCCQDAVFRDDRLQRFEEVLLDLKSLHHRFDHQVAGRKGVQ
ncbi:hypothetical protein D3C79_835950 [compost metagenome]